MPSKQFVRSYFKAFTQDPVQKCFLNESKSESESVSPSRPIEPREESTESQSDVLSRTQETAENQKELRRNQSENNSNITEDQLGEISRAADVEVNHISAPDWYVNKIPTTTRQIIDILYIV